MPRPPVIATVIGPVADASPALRAQVVRLGVDPELADRLTDLVGHADELRLGELAPNTLRAYTTDFADFQQWCTDHNVAALPAAAGAVAVYLAHLDRDTPLSVSAISGAWPRSRRPTASTATPRRPRTRTSARSGPASGANAAPGRRRRKRSSSIYLRAVVAPLGESLVDLRDRALLLVGFAGALRRSELAALQRSDLRAVARGLEVLVPQSKTDPFGKGQVIGIPRGQHDGHLPGPRARRVARGRRHHRRLPVPSRSTAGAKIAGPAGAGRSRSSSQRRHDRRDH